MVYDGVCIYVHICIYIYIRIYVVFMCIVIHTIIMIIIVLITIYVYNVFVYVYIYIYLYVYTQTILTIFRVYLFALRIHPPDQASAGQATQQSQSFRGSEGSLQWKFSAESGERSLVKMVSQYDLSSKTSDLS